MFLMRCVKLKRTGSMTGSIPYLIGVPPETLTILGNFSATTGYELLVLTALVLELETFILKEAVAVKSDRPVGGLKRGRPSSADTFAKPS